MTPVNKKSSIRSAGILGLILLGACIVIFHSYLFGNETFVFGDIGSDTKQQYLMQYNTIVNHLRDHSFSLWDFNNGFGVNMFGLNLTDPFLMLLYLLGAVFGPEHLALYLVYLHILKVVLAGIVCYYYLSCFGMSERAKLLAGVLYAFNGFISVWGQHYQFTTVAVMFPLLLLCIEKLLVRRRNALFLAAVSGVIVFGSLYWGYMCLLGGGIYLCFRLIQKDAWKWKEKGKLLLTGGFSMLLGVGMGAVNLFPVAALLFGASARLDSSMGLVDRLMESVRFWPGDYYKTILYNLFSSNLQSGASMKYSGFSNYYEDAHLFFSTLFVILLLQYIFTIHRQKAGKKAKAVQYAAVLAVLMSIVLECGSLIFNGFSYEFSRHTFLFMPLFALVCGKMLDAVFIERRLNIPALVVSAAGIVLVYGSACTGLKEPGYAGNALVLMATGLGMVLVLYLAARKKRRMASRWLCLMLSGLVLMNVVSDTALNYWNRDTLKKDDERYFEGTYHSSANEAVEYLKSVDPSFYRIEKDFDLASQNMDSLALNYRGISTYNSTQNRNILLFVERLWPGMFNQEDTNHYQFKNVVHDSSFAALFGIKYILTKKDDLKADGCQFLKQIGDVFIYRNTKTDSFGKFFTRTVSDTDFYNFLYYPDLDRTLSEVLVVTDEEGDAGDPYRISENELEKYRKEPAPKLIEYDKMDQTFCRLVKSDLTSSAHTQINLPLNGQKLEKYRRAWMEFMLESDVPTNVKIGTNDHRFMNIYLKADEPKRIRVTIPQGTKAVSLRVAKKKANIKLSGIKCLGSKKQAAFSKKADIRINDPKRDSRLSGTIKADEDGMVFLPIPYENGWSIKLDGQEQKIKKADYGFIAFEVKKGNHEVEITFKAPLFTLGAAVSLLSCLVFAALLAALLWNRSNRSDRSAHLLRSP